MPQADESRLGAGLGLLWGLPAVVVRAVSDSGHPSSSLGPTDLVGVIHVARALAEEVSPLHVAPPPFEPPPQLWGRVAPDLTELRAAARSALP